MAYQPNDYRSIDQTRQSTNARWWTTEDENERARDLFAVAKDIVDNQRDREADAWTHLRMYNGQARMGTAQVTEAFRGPKGMTLNVVQSIIDTTVAKVAATDIKSTVLTDGGSFSLQQKAKKLDLLVEGEFYANKFTQLAPEVLRDSLIFDIGIVKIYEPAEAKETVRIERVNPTDLLVDVIDGMYGKPRQIMHRTYMSRDVLKDMFPEHAAKIDECQRADFGGMFVALADRIPVIEAWHLPSGKDADDGMHIIAVENVTLVSEQYKKQNYPFVFLRAHTRPLGFWGQGFAEILAPAQIELNRLLKHQSRSLYLLANPRWYVRRGSRINLQHIDNEIGSIIVGDDPTPPQLMRNEPVSEQVIAQIENIYRKVYEIVGVSQVGAQAETPRNLDSGVAIRTHADMQTERLSQVGKYYEQFHIDVAYQVIDLMREIHERVGKFSRKVPGSKFLNTVDFGDADLENDEFLLKVYPTNLLPKTPEGRLQAVTDLLEASLVTKEQGLGLLDFPDLKAVNDLTNAPLENLMWSIDEVLENGNYRAPEPYQNLQLGLQLYTEALLKAERTPDLPEERKEMLRTWISQATAQIGAANQPPPGAPGAGTPVPPTAAPMPVPNSPLMPQQGAA